MKGYAMLKIGESGWIEKRDLYVVGGCDLPPACSRNLYFGCTHSLGRRDWGASQYDPGT